MRYNTGNPVGPDGSNSPFDLNDNSGVLDQLLNGSLGEYLSRLGAPLKSWRGIMKQVTDYLIAQGYESVYLTYGAGVVVQRQTQLVQRSGELYRVMNASDIPLTLTGTWSTDSPKLQAVGDAALRQALAASGGAAMIGRGAGTVDAALTALEARSSTAESDIDALQASDAQKQISLAQLLSGATKSHASVNGILYAQNPWGVRCLNVFGDSISFGANAQDIERDSWVGILKKMLNIEFGQSNIGVLNIVSQSSNADGTYKQYFEFASSQTGTWTSITGADAGHIPFGFALQSSVAGSTQNLKAPLSQRYMRVWYDSTVAGEIEVVINGSVVQTITALGSGNGYERGSPIELGTLVGSNKGW